MTEGLPRLTNMHPNTWRPDRIVPLQTSWEPTPASAAFMFAGERANGKPVPQQDSSGQPLAGLAGSRGLDPVAQQYGAPGHQLL